MKGEAQAGTIYDHYRLLEKLGEGGMGVVWLAQDTHLKRKVALKLLHPEAAQDPHRRQRFEQEARAAAALSHHRIATVHELAESQGQIFIVFEYVAGRTLRSRVMPGGLEPGELINISRDIAEALVAAHAANVIHRDLKPENVMRTPAGDCKVLDFGLARIRCPAFLDSEAETSARLTSQGMLLGTIAYMAPEQLEGKEVDFRCDIFSFGTLIYELATGVHPFQTGNQVSTMSAILTVEPTPLSQHNPRQPVELQRIVRKCLCKKREERYQSTLDLSVDLAKLQQEAEPTFTRGATPSPKGQKKTSRVDNVIAFGVFELDLLARELRKRGLRLKLQEQPIAVLEALLENHGQFVSREQLKQRLWPRGTHGDLDHALSIAVHKLRIALGDTAENPRFIETLPRRGYRFLLPITALAEGKDGKKTLLVLPFENLSPDPEQEYFVDGLTEEMISHLAMVSPERMGVIARTSSMTYKRTHKSIGEIVSELGVDFVMEGSVRRVGKRVRITTQLVRSDDQTQIWAESFDQEVSDILGLQAEVSVKVAKALQLVWKPLQATSRPNFAAYELYLQARFFWNQRSENSVLKAVEYFTRAIEADPNYAMAHVGMSDSFGVIGYYGALPQRQAYSRAKASALRAIDLDPGSPQAHSSLAFALLQDDWDWPAAERAHLHALELNIELASSHHWYGIDLTQIGRLKEAQRELQRALKLDPLCVAIHAHMGRVFYFSRQYAEAADWLARALAIDDTFVPAYFFLAFILCQTGDHAGSCAAAARGVELTGGHPLTIACLVAANVSAGRKKQALEQLGKLQEQSGRRHVSPFCFAFAHAAMGETKKALEALEKAHAERSAWLFYLKNDPAFDGLRGHAQFVDIMQRVEALSHRSATAGM